MMKNQPGLWSLFVCIAVLHGCSGDGTAGAPETAGPGGAATVTVAGLQIEAFPTGSDGGSVSEITTDNGVHKVTISEVKVVVTSRDDGLLELTIDGKDYGTVRAGDDLRIGRDRRVFLNDQRLDPEA